MKNLKKWSKTGPGPKQDACRYYRDDTDAFDEIVLGGNVRIHFEGNDENFEIVVQRAYQQNVNSGDNPLNNSESFITIERHAYQVA